MTRTEAADALGVTTGTVDRYVRDGRLERQRNPITGRTWFKAADVAELRRIRDGEVGA